jgi:hypothetical protein
MARISVRPGVIETLLAYEGQVITLADLLENLPRGAQAASVRSAMRHLIEGGEMDITVIAAGNTWRLNSLVKPDLSEKANPSAGKSLGLFEQVGEMQDGSLVVRDESNRLYALKAL